MLPTLEMHAQAHALKYFTLNLTKNIDIFIVPKICACNTNISSNYNLVGS
jgi:hypothetical protein